MKKHHLAFRVAPSRPRRLHSLHEPLFWRVFGVMFPIIWTAMFIGILGLFGFVAYKLATDPMAVTRFYGEMAGEALRGAGIPEMVRDISR